MTYGDVFLENEREFSAYNFEIADTDFLFSELDSLGVTHILMALSAEYDIELEASDATPKNLRNIDSIVAMVQKKIGERDR